MPDAESFNSAAEALAQAAQGESQVDSYGLPPVETNQPEPPDTPDVGDQSPGTPSKDIDINQLPEEARLWLQAREREMTGDYTRKTQELAQRQDEFQQQLAFLQALNSDPNFASQVYQELGKSLQASGFLQAGQEDFEAVDEYGQPFDDPYQDRFDKIDAWIQQQEAQQMYVAAEAHLNNQLAALRNQHPDWKDADFERVIDLGFATGGDLHKAAEQYGQWQQDVVSRYMEQKGSVQAPGALPNQIGSEPADQPTTPADLHRMALERMRMELGD